MMKAIFGVTGVPSLPWRSHERLLDLWRLWPINKINLRSFWVDISLQNSSHNTILVSSKHWQATADLIPARSRANLFSFRRLGKARARSAHAFNFLRAPKWSHNWARAYSCPVFPLFLNDYVGSGLHLYCFSLIFSYRLRLARPWLEETLELAVLTV